MPAPLIISHASCQDGFAAAWLARRVWPSCEIRFHQYNKDPAPVQSTPPGDHIIIVDFSYPREQLIALRQRIGRTGSLTVLDHHRTAEKHCAGLDFCQFDQQRSGAMMMRDYLRELDLIAEDPAVWALIDYVQDRDLWHWKLPESRHVNAALSSYPFDFSEWDALVARPEAITFLMKEGAAIERYRRQQIAQLLKHPREVTFGEHVGMATCCPVANFISDVGGELAATPGAAFGATWFDDYATGTRVWSLRARPDDNPASIDVGQLAERMGGGGHQNAAGFRVPM